MIVPLYEKYAQLELITSRMVYNTVMCDERTCLWFRKIFSLPVVIERIKASSEGEIIRRRYQTHSFAAAVFAVAAVVCLGWSLTGRLFSQWSFTGAAIFALLSAAGCGFFLLQSRRSLAALSAHLIKLDHALIPPGTTLFQLGEIYSRHYGTPSLVTVIWIWDQWLRNAFLLTFTVTMGVLFFPSWETVLAIVVACVTTACLVKIWVMARHSEGKGISSYAVISELQKQDEHQKEPSHK